MRDDDQYFRAGVGAVILDDRGRVLTFERSDVPDAWQLPQGGLDRDEEPGDAILREVEEETGIGRERIELIATLPEPLAYELPPAARSDKTGRGQVNYWFVFRLQDPASEIEPPVGEFSRARWMPLQRLVEETVDFRRPVYRRILDFITERIGAATGASRAS